MSLQNNYLNFLKVLETYNEKLSTYSEARFQQKPNEDTWSYAQVYAHILMANKLSIKGMQRSAENKGTLSKKLLPLKAQVILFFGKFPKGRKVPKSVEQRTPKLESIEDTRALIKSIQIEIQEVYKTSKSWNASMKFPHPVLGLMNNEQWLRFILIHSSHHLKQLERIDKLLNN